MSLYTISLSNSLFSPSYRPLWWFLKAKKAGHFLEGGIMAREELQQQMPHIWSASLSLCMHTNKRCCWASLHIKKDKIRSLKTEERRRQKQSSEVTTKGTSCTYKSNAKGKVKFLQTPALAWILSVAMRMIGVFFPAFLSPPTKRGQHLHNHFAMCIGGLTGCHLSYEQTYESAKEYF